MQEPISYEQIKKLAGAVLVQSLNDINHYGRYGRDPAMDWLYSNNTGYVFDFLTICQILNLDPGKIREAVKTSALNILFGDFK